MLVTAIKVYPVKESVFGSLFCHPDLKVSPGHKMSSLIVDRILSDTPMEPLDKNMDLAGQLTE